MEATWWQEEKQTDAADEVDETVSPGTKVGSTALVNTI